MLCRVVSAAVVVSSCVCKCRHCVIQELHEWQLPYQRLCQVPTGDNCLCVYLPGCQAPAGKSDDVCFQPLKKHLRTDVSVHLASGHCVLCRNVFVLFFSVYVCILCLVRYLFVISTSVIDCPGRFVPEMTYYVSSGTLNLAKLWTLFTVSALWLYGGIDGKWLWANCYVHLPNVTET